MKYIRIKSSKNKYFNQAFELYKRSFPLIERRELKELLRVLKLPQFHFNALLESGEFVGTAIFWEADDFIYFEYLCILETKRNNGIGSDVLLDLANRNKPVIFEIEKPTDEISSRRIKHYQKLGFVLGDVEHTQVKYRQDDDEFKMFIMTYKKPVTAVLYQKFRKFLDDVVAPKFK